MSSQSWAVGRLQVTALIAGVVVAFAVAGCSTRGHWAELRSELAALRAARQELPAGPGWLDLRGAIHVHSEVSHDSEGTPEEIVAGARAAELDFVIMTDHATPEIFTRGMTGRYGELVVIRGMEVIDRCRRLANRCATLLAVGIDTWFDPDALGFPAMLEEIERQGGLSFVAHPKGWRAWDLEGITGLEIYDVLDDVVEELWKAPKWGLDIWYAHDEYAPEIFLQILDRPSAHLRRWDALNAESSNARWVGIGGNDAHRNQRFLGRQLDPYAIGLRLVTTHVLARSRDEGAILEGLREGRAYVAFEGLADAGGFRFGARAEDRSALLGEEIAPRPGLVFETETPLPARIELLRDGSPIASCVCEALRHPAAGLGVYRVEASLRVKDRWWPWILSNPIYVR